MKKLVLIALVAMSFSSCSVYMAAKKEGTDITNVQKCRSRSQFLAEGGTLVSNDRLENGDVVDVYRFQKERGSVSRAFMHGLLDVSTFGLWEAVGTPIEGMDSKEYYTIQVVYDQNGNVKHTMLN